MKQKIISALFLSGTMLVSNFAFAAFIIRSDQQNSFS